MNDRLKNKVASLYVEVFRKISKNADSREEIRSLQISKMTSN